MGGTNSGMALNNEQIMILLANKIIEGGIMGDGQIMIGSSILQPIPTNIISTENSIVITNRHNSINLETSSTGSYSTITSTGNSIVITNGHNFKNLKTSSTESYSTITLTLTSNQVIFSPIRGTTITLNAANPVASLVYNLSDVSANLDFVLTNFKWS